MIHGPLLIEIDRLLGCLAAYLQEPAGDRPAAPGPGTEGDPASG
ncbi:hypothetical protein [Actinomadura sp. KC06]|nr:hypothetical protein [Actinomadura sp. KC06]